MLKESAASNCPFHAAVGVVQRAAPPSALRSPILTDDYAPIEGLSADSRSRVRPLPPIAAAKRE